MVDSEHGGSSDAPASYHPALVVVAMVVTLLLIAGVAAPPAVARSDDRLRAEIERLGNERRELRGEQAQLRHQQQQLSQELQEVTERLDALTEELAQLHDEAARMRRSVRALQTQADRDRDRLRSRLSRLYQGASTDGLLGLLDGATPTELIERGHYLSLLAAKDREGLEALTASTVALNRERQQLARTTARVEAVGHETEMAQRELDERLAEAAERSDRLKRAIAQRDAGIDRRERELARREGERRRAAEEQRRLAEARRSAAAQEAAERRRQAASRARRAEEAAQRPARRAQRAAPAGGGLTCPQDHPRSFTDTWGAARSGGRRHQGTDIFGHRGGDVFAIVDGVVTTTRSGGLAGLMLVLRGDDGHEYWYLHLQDFVAGSGQRVGAGELIAHNGDTGNARGTTPHIHFEHHPGGGGPVNPYPLLRRACG